MNTQENLLENSQNGAAKCVDGFRYIRSLWQEHFDDPLSVAEIALVIYLLDRANRLRWAMPFVCPTAAACNMLQISKPTFIKAREGLSRRGMISFTEGTGTNELPTYSVALPNSVLRRPRGASQSTTPTSSLSPSSASDFSPVQSSTPTQPKVYSSAANVSNDLVDLNVLQTRLISDTQWMIEIVDMMKPTRDMTAADVKAGLADFFRYLRCQGNTAKSEAECRKHFVNWLRKQSAGHNHSTYGVKSNGVDLRRPSPVTATSASDYEGQF